VYLERPIKDKRGTTQWVFMQLYSVTK
jgi:hypothetical protein